MCTQLGHFGIYISFVLLDSAQPSLARGNPVGDTGRCILPSSRGSKRPGRRASLPGSLSTNFSTLIDSFRPPTTSGGTHGHILPRVNPGQISSLRTQSPRGLHIQVAQRPSRKRTIFFGRKPRARATLYCACAKSRAKAGGRARGATVTGRTGPSFLART